MRLDHLLSKEHHEKGGAVGLARAVKGSRAVVAVTGCATTKSSFLKVSGFFGGRNRWAHCWVLRQHLDRVGCCRLTWWWGVVFGNWIVVASIEGMRCPVWGGVFLCAIFDENFGFCCVCKC